jgi:hypothetical protein
MRDDDTDTGTPYWVPSDYLADLYDISHEAVRKNIRRRDLGIKVNRTCGGKEWMAPLPLYRAWRAGDTGEASDERRIMKVLAERLSVP